MPHAFRFAMPVAALAALVTAAPAAAHHNGRANWHLGDRAPLKQGMSGHDVKILQDFLTKTGFETDVDGHFGRGTTKSVRAFERAQGRRADGRLARGEIRLLRTAVKQGTQLRSATSDDEPTARPAAGKATLNPDGTAVPPADAPPEVVKVIEAGNAIAKTPYKYGGGHTEDFEDSGYDCSGSVSYALHGADLLERPLPSGSFTSWGESGRGRWITTYANSGHIYMVVAGLRFDTSARKRGGNRWTTESRTSRGYTARHPEGL